MDRKEPKASQVSAPWQNSPHEGQEHLGEPQRLFEVTDLSRGGLYPSGRTHSEGQSPGPEEGAILPPRAPMHGAGTVGAAPATPCQVLPGAAQQLQRGALSARALDRSRVGYLPFADPGAVGSCPSARSRQGLSSGPAAWS